MDTFCSNVSGVIQGIMQSLFAHMESSQLKVYKPPLGSFHKFLFHLQGVEQNQREKECICLHVCMDVSINYNLKHLSSILRHFIIFTERIRQT